MNRTALLLAALGMLVLGNQSHAAVGRTPGQFGVSPVGSAQYTIPIFAPPGPHRLQPSISLFYDSNQGNGPLGFGWVLAGLGSITRCNQTIAQDGAAAPVTLATSDGYCLNGKRLRLTSGTYGTSGSVYQTEIADFSQITANGTAGNGPAYFTVQGHNGLTYEYGYTDSNGYGANSQVLASGTTTAVTWFLSKVIDRSGNSIAINWITGTSTAVPGTIYWGNSTAQGSSYNYQMVFTYSTNNPQTSIYGYVSGSSKSNVNLLTDITVTYAGTTVKKYVLSYQSSPTTSRNRLTQVKECADAGATNCLAASTIGYQNGTVGISSSANTAVSSATKLVAKYDFNGDGYTDLAYFQGNTLYVAFGSASGFGTPVNTGVSSSTQTALYGDLQGTGTDQILAVNGSTWYAYKWNSTSKEFVGTSTGLAADTAVMLTDVNGDGLPDLLYISVSLVGSQQRQAPPPASTPSQIEVSLRLNTSTSSAVSFGSLGGAWSEYYASKVGAQFVTPDSQSGKLRAFDFDGDGRKDVAVVVSSGSPITYSYFELFSQGTYFTGIELGGGASSNTSVGFLNFNDDACTDLLWFGSIYISPCAGSGATGFSVPGGTVLTVADYDSDGRGDVFVPNGSTIGVYRSNGSGLSSTITSTSIPYSSACTYFTFDANGDGLDDLGCITSSGSVTYYPHNGAATPPDLASSFTDGYGNSVSPAYVPLTNSSVYLKGSNAVYPYSNYIGPMYVVNQATLSDPSTISGSYKHTYAYFWGWMNLQGRGFSGFAGGMTDTDSRTGVNTFPYYGVAFPYTGMLYEIWTTQPNTGSVFTSKLTNTFASITLNSAQNNERYFPYVQNSTTLKYELGGAENGDLISTTSTNYTYDDYGNATEIATTVTDNDPGSPYVNDSWTTTVTNTPDVDTTHWCLGLFTETQVAYTATIGSAVTRTQTFTPDTTNCRYTQIVTEPTANGGLYKVTEGLTFDSFGNVATDTVTGANMPSSPASRETQQNWGTTGQFLNYSIDASGAKTTWSYTSNQALTFGVPDSVKDPNNLTTSWQYDSFGRKTKETRPDSTSTVWAWSLCTSDCGWSNSVYQIAQTLYQTNGTTAIRTDTNSYDPIDRVTQIAGPTVTGTAATVQILYNSLGQLSQQSMPFLSGGSTYQQTYSFDILNRILSITRPISSTNSNPQSTTYAYAGRKLTVSDPYGHTKTLTTDVNGWQRKTTDALGYTVTTAYDSAGSVLGRTDGVGNTLLSGVTIAYGVKPFITAADDADLGAWTYTIDSLGERTGWKDAKGQSFSMSYDALSRPLTRTEPDLFTEWNYGSAAPSFGRLTSECTQSASTANLCTTSGSSWLYNEIIVYDNLARLSTRTVTESGNTGGNDGNGSFLFTYGYSTTIGLLSSLTYPKSNTSTALNVGYGYQYGLLDTVTDTTDTTATCGTTCTLWTANAANARGQITEETLGNNVVTNRTYDAVTSWLTKATAGVTGGSGLLNQSYLQDENGNVTQRQDNNQGLTESFGYDADSRLICAQLSGSCTITSYQYDNNAAGPGNITYENGSFSSLTYPAPGNPRPHAVTSAAGNFNGIVNPTFSYDANGNMTARASSAQNVYWYSSNYPLSITGTDATGTEEVEFNYGPDRQRWAQTYTGPSGTETTYYVGGGTTVAPALLDVVFNGSTNYRYYIYAGGEPIAVYNRSGSTYTMSYDLEDHQGSVSVFASNAGAKDVGESFSAFGQRRNPTTWSGPPSTSDLNTIAGLSRQGYTFQTWLGQSMGLNHMNGRVQDAILGSFVSPDPSIPDPTSAQSYNRYSYVQRNPLTRVDADGFDDALDQEDGGSAQDWADQTYTGSRIPGYISASYSGCYGNCADVNSAYNNMGSGAVIGNLNNGAANSTTPGVSGGNSSIATATSSTAVSDNSGTAASANSPTSNPGSGVSAQSGGCVGSPCAAQLGNSAGDQSGGALAFLGPLGGVAATGTTTGLGALIAAATTGAIGLLAPNPTASDDTTYSSDQYVFHYATDAKMAMVLADGAITPSSQGVVWVSPTPYASAAAAQSSLALPNTPNGYFIVPVQNVQTPLTWTAVRPNFGQPGGGTEGTTPLPIPVNGPGGPIVWVPFPK